MLNIEEIKQLHNAAYIHGQSNREEASDDLLFSRYTQWDETFRNYTSLRIRMQFDLIRKGRRHLISQMRENQIDVKFRPLDGADADAADILEGMHRADMNNVVSKEAVDVAVGDQVDCGFGAYRLVTEYENKIDDLDNRQVIRRVPIHEANNVVFFDSNAKLMDKSDADWVSIITSYTREGLKKVAKEYGKPEGWVPTPYAQPEESWTFPWAYSEGDTATFRIGEFYHREKKTQHITLMMNPQGQTQSFITKDIKDRKEEMQRSGYVMLGEKTREHHIVNKYVCTGDEVLSGPQRVAGEHLPVIPVYGERYFVEGVEIYEGITRRAKDPQRLHNMQQSHLAEIVSKGPERKPFFFPEQVKGFEDMYDVEADHPYYLLRRLTENGEELPPGPVNYMEYPLLPEATAAVIELTRQSVADVTDPGLPQDVANSNISGKAVNALQNRLDMQTFVYLDNLRSALRRDGEVYASMASELYDTPRKVKMMGPDQGVSEAVVMDNVVDIASGQQITMNDLTIGRFEAYADTGPSFQTQKMQVMTELKELYPQVEDPNIRNILLLQILSMQEGSAMDMIKNYANNQLLVQGIKEPENEEEEQFLAQIQEQQEIEAQNPTPQDALMQSLQSEAQSNQAQAQERVAKGGLIQAQTIETLEDARNKKIENDAAESGLLELARAIN